MKMYRSSLLLWGWAVSALPALVWAQASGESTDMGPTPDAPAPAPAQPPPRSSLWEAIDAVHRRRSVPAPDRRLSHEERQQLREQIRRAGLAPERGAAGAAGAAVQVDQH